MVAVAMSAGAVQPDTVLNDTVWAPATKPVAVALLARHMPPSTRHCAPAETASAGIIVTFKALETGGAKPTCPFNWISSR